MAETTGLNPVICGFESHPGEKGVNNEKDFETYPIMMVAVAIALSTALRGYSSVWF